MLKIDFVNGYNDEIGSIIDEEFNKYAKENNVTCNYTPFIFVAKENDEIIGIITGHSYYDEVHIGDLIVLKEHRHKHIGTQLVKYVEEYYKDKNFQNINLTTYEFQALDFYKKCGYNLEYVRENKENPKLTKYFLVKYF